MVAGTNSAGLSVNGVITADMHSNGAASPFYLINSSSDEFYETCQKPNFTAGATYVLSRRTAQQLSPGCGRVVPDTVCHQSPDQRSGKRIEREVV